MPTPASMPTPAATPVIPGIRVSSRATYSNGVHKNKGDSISVIERKYSYVNKTTYDYEVSMLNEDKFKSGILTDYSVNTGDGDPRDHTYSYTLTLDDGSVLTFGDLDSPRKYYFRTDMTQSGGRKLRKGRKSRKTLKSRKTRKVRK
jgi:hypothetical protein